jgi:hypothetical protein
MAIGRPSKYSQERAETIVQRVREGLSFSSACQSIGVPKQTGSDWRHEYSDFSDAIAVAEKESEMELLGVLRKAAIGHDSTTYKHTISDKNGETIEEVTKFSYAPGYAAWILARRFPEQWSEQNKIQKLVQAAVREVIKNIMEYSSDNTRTEVATIIAARPEIMEVDPTELESTQD